MVDMWRSSPPTRRVHLGCVWLGRCGCAGWSVFLQTTLAVGKLSGRVSLRIQHPFPVLLEGLPSKNLRVQVGGIYVGANVFDDHVSSTAQFSHLEHFAIHVAAVGR